LFEAARGATLLELRFDRSSWSPRSKLRQQKINLFHTPAFNEDSQLILLNVRADGAFAFL